MDIQQSIRRLLGGSLVLIATFSHPVLAEYTSHGISLYGEPKYTEKL
ncbi:hypothetical protein ACPSKX_19555 [Moritella viscosa]